MESLEKSSMLHSPSQNPLPPPVSAKNLVSRRKTPAAPPSAGVYPNGERRDLYRAMEPSVVGIPSLQTPPILAHHRMLRKLQSGSQERQIGLFFRLLADAQMHIQRIFRKITSVVYCRTFADVERASMELLELIEAKKRNVEPISLGLDIEWRPTFRRGEASRKAAVLQICMDNDWCYVMHIIHSGIPPTLQSILEDATSTKVGVGIYNDVAKVMKDYNVRIQVVADLAGLAKLKFGGVPRNWSLGALTEMLTCKELEKPKKIRLGNWEADVLSKEQIHYAATDAYASWYLFQVLKSFPDAADNPLVDKDASDVQS